MPISQNKSTTYTEDKDYIAISPEKIDHNKLKKEIEEHDFSAIIVEYDNKGDNSE